MPNHHGQEKEGSDWPDLVIYPPLNPEGRFSPTSSESGIKRSKGWILGRYRPQAAIHLRFLRSWNVGILKSECRALELWKCVRIRTINTRTTIGVEGALHLISVLSFPLLHFIR